MKKIFAAVAFMIAVTGCTPVAPPAQGTHEGMQCKCCQEMMKEGGECCCKGMMGDAMGKDGKPMMCDKMHHKSMSKAKPPVKKPATTDKHEQHH